MTRSLRRTLLVVLICALLLVTWLFMLSTRWAVQRGVADVLSAQAVAAAEYLDERIRESQEQLRLQVADVAQWDELYQRAPQVDLAWAEKHVQPGRIPGSPADVFILGDAGRIWGRYRAGSVGSEEPDAMDTVSVEALRSLLTGRQNRSLLAIVDGEVVLLSQELLRNAQGAGAHRGFVLGLRYLREERWRALAPFAWDVQVHVHPADGICLLGTQSVQVEIIPQTQSVRLRYGSEERGVTLELSPLQDLTQHILSRAEPLWWSSAWALCFFVGAAAVMLLIWYFRPIRLLAQTCASLPSEAQGFALEPFERWEESLAIARSVDALLARAAEARSRTDRALRDQERLTALQARFARRTLEDLNLPVQGLLARLQHHPDADTAKLVATLSERLAVLRGLGGDGELQKTDTVHLLCDLQALALDLAALFAPVARARGVRVIVHPAPVAIAVDPQGLRQVLMNLLSNAIQAPGCRMVQVRLQSLDGGASIELQDDGAGIPTALRERMERACREGVVAPGEAGFGLGLPLTFAALQTLRGRVELVESDGPGTTFRILVPDRLHFQAP